MDLIVEWAGIFLRWAHVLAGILWIGESFYFIALDSSLKKDSDLPAGRQRAGLHLQGSDHESHHL